MVTSNYHVHVLFVQISLMVLGVVIFICVLNPMVLLFTLPLIVIFVFVRTFFLKTSRDVKRLEGTSKYGVTYVCCCFLGKTKQKQNKTKKTTTTRTKKNRKRMIICCPQVGKLGRWVGLEYKIWNWFNAQEKFYHISYIQNLFFFIMNSQLVVQYSHTSQPHCMA